MEVLDIVHRAVLNSGVVSSFNEDEIPEDIEQRASTVLRNEILPALNCDRTIDITEIALKFIPVHNTVVLRTTPKDYDRQVIGPLDAPSQFLLVPDANDVPQNLIAELQRTGYLDSNASPTPKWQEDMFGNKRNLAVWSSDCKLLLIPNANPASWQVNDIVIDQYYNVPFPPMRVVDVIRMSDGCPMEYVHVSEMLSAEYRYSSIVYATEDFADCLKIIFNPNVANQPVFVVLPVPLTINDSYDEPKPWRGTIVAPAKFMAYLVNVLAFRMAVEYGVSTAPQMEKLADTSYQLLKKNLSKQAHKQDLDRKINTYLERGRGFGIARGAFGSGYNG